MAEGGRKGMNSGSSEGEREGDEMGMREVCGLLLPPP